MSEINMSVRYLRQKQSNWAKNLSCFNSACFEMCNFSKGPERSKRPISKPKTKIIAKMD